MFIIYDNVKIYRDSDSLQEILTLNHFDSVIVLSEISENNRINIQLSNGAKGWVDERFLSNIPKDWKKIILKDNYCFYSDENIEYSFNLTEDKRVLDYQFIESRYNVNFQINNTRKYFDALNSIIYLVTGEVESGSDKNLNWIKKIDNNKYYINYVITTFDPQGNITESFDFCKKGEEDNQKYYSIWTSYHPSISLDELLIQRKILFSALRSLK